MPPRMGMLGPLPLPAWREVLQWLSSPNDPTTWDSYWSRMRPPHASTVYELRLVCTAMLELVAECCIGGAGWVWVPPRNNAWKLQTAPTAHFGRSLVAKWALSCWATKKEHQRQELAKLAQIALAMQRGHMIHVKQHLDPSPELLAPVMKSANAVLLEASREGLLLHADLGKGEQGGWTVETLAQVQDLWLREQDQESVAKIVRDGAVRRLELFKPSWTDMTVLSAVQEVTLGRAAVHDVSPLADVPRLVLWECHGIRAVPAMRNDYLELCECNSLVDLSGLADGRVGTIKLYRLYEIEDVEAIAAMRPLPRAVILHSMSEVRDVSPLAGIHRVEINCCIKINKAATLEALRGRTSLRFHDSSPD